MFLVSLFFSAVLYEEKSMPDSDSCICCKTTAQNCYPGGPSVGGGGCDESPATYDMRAAADCITKKKIVGEAEITYKRSEEPDTTLCGSTAHVCDATTCHGNDCSKHPAGTICRKGAPGAVDTSYCCRKTWTKLNDGDMC